MGGAPHLRTVRAYGAIYRLLNVVNPALAVITSVSSRGRGPADSPGRGGAGVISAGTSDR
jgi:hypothetical protein